MGLSRAIRKQYYNLCRADEPLSPNDPRNVDIDDIHTAGALVRGRSWVNRLAAPIEVSDGPCYGLFTGLPGSGKSTELRRLAARLRSKEGANLLPVIVNAEEALDIFSTIDVPDILMNLLRGTEQALYEEEGRVLSAPRETYWGRFWSFLTTVDSSFSRETRLAVSDVTGITQEMKTRPLLRKKVREAVSTHVTSFVGEVREEFKRLDTRARALGYDGLVVVLDTLEKLSGLEGTWESVLDSAEAAFSSGLLKLPVHTLYTVPPSLISRAPFHDVRFMPMIKLHDRAGDVFEPGFEVGREIVRRRIPDPVLHEIFGAEHAEASVRRIIEESGGFPRNIVRPLQTVLAEASETLSPENFNRLMIESAETWRRTVDDDDLPLLAAVARSGRLPVSDASRQRVSRLLRNNIIMRFLNDAEWFDVHPAVRSMREFKELLQSPAATT